MNVEGLCAANYNMLVELMELHNVKVMTGAVVEKYENGTAYVAQKVGNVPNANGRASHVSLHGLRKFVTEIPGNLMSVIWKAYEVAMDI